jgi:hypothetical protein
MRMNRLPVPAASLGRWQPGQLAITGEQMVLAGEDGQIQVVDWRSPSPPIASWQTDLRPTAIALSPSGTHLLLGDDRGPSFVVGADTGAVVVDLGHRTRAGLLRSDDGDIVVWSRDSDYRVAVTALDGPTALMDLPDAPTMIASVSPLMTDRLAFLAVLAPPGETTYSLGRLSLPDLVADGRDALRDTIAGRPAPRLHDRAYRLAVGPAGPDHAVIFRDPEDDLEEPEDIEDIDDPREREVWGFRGIVIRRVDDGTLVEHIDHDIPGDRPSTPIFATGDVVVIGGVDYVEVVARGGSDEVLRIPCVAHAFDPVHRHVLVAHDPGTFEVIEFPA